MRVVFGNWKYLFKNLWYVLPCGIVPAVFLALCFDYTATAEYVRSFFTGNPRADFVQLFRVWSLVRIDSVLGGIYAVFAFFCVGFFAAFLVSLVEKHVRIGKRTLNGAGKQLGSVVFSVFCIVLLYTMVAELWALVISAVTFAISSLASDVLVYLLALAAFAVIAFLFLYLVEVFFLWLPCMQATGFRPYDAFLYSYRLSMKVRWRLVLAHAMSLLAFVVLVGGSAFLPEIVSRIVAFGVYLFLFTGFFVRMETVYYEADKLDREDLIKSYREL